MWGEEVIGRRHTTQNLQLLAGIRSPLGQLDVRYLPVPGGVAEAFTVGRGIKGVVPPPTRLIAMLLVTPYRTYVLIVRCCYKGASDSGRGHRISALLEASEYNAQDSPFAANQYTRRTMNERFRLCPKCHS